MNEEGYLLCCFGDKLYFKLAKRLITSIRQYDTRPICILTDNVENIDYSFNNLIVKEFNYKNHMHHNIDINNKWNIYGLLPKLYQVFYTPFKITCFLDCDVIFYNNEFLKFWNMYYNSKKHILVPGTCNEFNRSPSNWHWGHVNEIINNIGFNIPGVLSSLIIYNQNLKIMVESSLPRILDNIWNIGCKPFFNGGFPDEIIFSIIFGMYNVYPDNELHNMWIQDVNWNSCDKNV